MGKPITGDDPQSLVSTEWLAAHLEDPDLRILDASYFLPGTTDRDARAEYETLHIPGARFFDIDEVSDARSALPHMVAPAEKFMSRMRALGVGDGHQVVVYDSVGLYSAARVWWNFRLMGKTDIAVLDGGLPKWQSEGRPVEDMPPVTRDRHITVQRQAHLVKDVTQVAAASKLGDWQILDARSPGRFRGEEEEPRAWLRRGRIPNSLNVHYASLLTGDGTLKENEALRAVFTAAGADPEKRAIVSCGSGVTAAIVMLALYRLGNEDVALYDGSWSEWGQFEQLKVETG